MKQKITLLVGAEGASEIEQQNASWARDATAEEIAEFKKENPDVSSIDKIGRPYFYKTVLPDAPTDIYTRASECIRILRF